jgi:hypothetical protein
MTIALAGSAPQVRLVLTAEQRVKRLIWLIPPARLHWTKFHGSSSSP